MDSSESDEIISLNEETRETSTDEKDFAVAIPKAGNALIPHKAQTKIALLPNENESEGQQQSEVVIAGGNFQGAVLGPQNDNRKVEMKAEDYRHATITHHHEVHHHYAPGSEELSTSSASSPKGTQEKALQPDKDFVPISEDIFMSETPLRKGARIYKGYQQHAFKDRRELAIKMITPCEDMHVKEVHSLLRLVPHPNIVQIISSRQRHYPGSPRVLYIAMELCGSQNLQDFLNKNRKKKTPFNVKKAMSFAKQLVNGLKHIHVNKIIHRDLKPENILISVDGETIKVTDFGISKQMKSDGTFTRLTAPDQGTDGFRSPESFQSDVLSRSADIFCLGLVLYALFTNGKHAFGQNVLLLNNNIASNQGRDLTGLLISGPKREQLLDLLSQTFEHDPKKRPTIEQVSNHPFFSNIQVSSTDVAPKQFHSELSAPKQLPKERALTQRPLEQNFLTAEETFENKDLTKHVGQQEISDEARQSSQPDSFDNRTPVANRSGNFPWCFALLVIVIAILVAVTMLKVDTTTARNEPDIILTEMSPYEVMSYHYLNTSKPSEAIPVLINLPPSQHQQEMLAESYLREGKDADARICMETIKSMMTSSSPRPKVDGVVNLIDSYISKLFYIRALVLLPSASMLYELGSDPNHVIWGISNCALKCYYIIEKMFKQGGRMREIAVGVGIEMLNQMLVNVQSVDGADPGGRAEMESHVLNFIGLYHQMIGKPLESLNFFQKGFDLMKQQFGTHSSRHSVVGIILTCMAYSHQLLAQNREAEKLYSKSLEALESARDFANEEQKNKITKIAKRMLKMSQTLITKRKSPL